VSKISNRTLFSCDHYPVKVGEFHSRRFSVNESVDNDGTSKVTTVTNVTYSPKLNIDWPGNHKPVDEPHCGYRYCP